MSIAAFRRSVGLAPREAASPLAPRRPRSLHKADIAVLLTSVASSVCLVWFVFYQLTLFSGAAGFVITSILVFLLVYFLINKSLFGKMTAVDRVVAALITLGSAGVVTALGFVIGFLASRGYHLISTHFLTHSMEGVTQTAPASAGGVAHAIVGTLEEVGLAVVMGAPAGVATAIFLNEVGGRITAAVRIVITAMSAIPSILAGLFIYVLVITELHYSFRGFAGSLALAVLLLPNITRTTEEVLKVVHGSLREASMALGAPEWRTVWSVVLPTARTGIVTALLLGIARVVGETAPLLVTVSSNPDMNWNPFANPQEALPIFIWQSYALPYQKDVERAFAAGLVLVGLVLILFVLARIVAAVKPGSLHHLSHRFQRNALETP
jgi:phosphate transport system permease protein